MPGRQPGRWTLALPALLALAAFLPVLWNDPVWDDRDLFAWLETVRDPASWRDAVRQPLIFSPDYFRPLAVLTMLMESHWAGGPDTGVMHATNWALHGANVFLVTLLARHVVDDSRAAQLAAGLLYGLHAALIEGVAFMACRFDLLVTFFLLLALLADARVARTGVRATLVGVAFLLAALSKEMAATFVLVLPLWHMGKSAGGRPDWRRHVPSYVAVVFAGLAYLLVRFGTLGYLLSGESELPDTGTGAEHAALVARTLGTYTTLIVWPFTSVTPVHFATFPLEGSRGWSILAVLIVTALVLLTARRRRVGALALACVAALLPVLNLRPVVLGDSIAADRFLLFPLVLAVMAAVAGFARMGRPRMRTIALGAWLVASITVIETTLPHWRGRVPLWTWVIERAPLSGRAWANLALSQTDAGDVDAAVVSARRAIELDPEGSIPLTNLGHALYTLQRFDEAAAAFEKALELEPTNLLVWSNLARTVLDAGDGERAEKILLEKVIAQAPDMPEANLNLTVLYLRAGRPDLAETYVQRISPRSRVGQHPDTLALSEQARSPDGWMELGDRLANQGDGDPALRAYAGAAERGATPADVVKRAEQAFGAQDLEMCAKILDLAVRAWPRAPVVHNALGVLAKERGETDAARKHFERALELDPGWEPAKIHLEALAE